MNFEENSIDGQLHGDELAVMQTQRLQQLQQGIVDALVHKIVGLVVLQQTMKISMMESLGLRANGALGAEVVHGEASECAFLKFGYFRELQEKELTEGCLLRRIVV